MADFLPRADSALLAWSNNFSQRINLDPERLNLSPETAAEYGQLHQAFAEAHQKAHDPGTRTIPSTVGKNESRAALKRKARELNGVLRASPTVPQDDLVLLGLRPRSNVRSRTPRPQTAPLFTVLSTLGQRVRLMLRDPESVWRVARPGNVTHAVIVYAVGDTAPSSEADYTLCRMTGRTMVDINLPNDIPIGTRVWFKGYWINPRAERGPWSQPTGVNVGHSLAG